MNNDFTDDTAMPNMPTTSKLNPRQTYIEHTNGLWIRKNRKEDTIEIWLNGEEIAAWRGADEIDVRLQTMFRVVYNHGINVGIKANQQAIKEALGLANDDNLC